MRNVDLAVTYISQRSFECHRGVIFVLINARHKQDFMKESFKTYIIFSWIRDTAVSLHLALATSPLMTDGERAPM